MTELTLRHHRDPEAAGDARTGESGTLEKRLLADPREMTEGDLVAVVIGDSWPADEDARQILTDCGGLSGLVRSATASDLLERFSGREARSPRPLAARVLALTEVASRFHSGAVDVSAQVAVELSLTLLGLGGRVLQAVARRPDPHLLGQCAELMDRAHRIGSDLIAGERVLLPDVEGIRAALDEIGRRLGDGVYEGGAGR